MPKSFLRQARVLACSQLFNLDNGNGVTVSELLFNTGSLPVRLLRVYALYNQITQTVAGGTFQLGTTAGGVDLVAATAYENAAAIGAVTEATLATDVVPKSTTVWVTHTGVAATQTGTARVVVEYVYDE